jgi:O-antigen/teichoic acid export membrane protein
MQGGTTTRHIPLVLGAKGPNRHSKVTEARDRTGRSTLVSNVAITWVGQMIYLATGFIMPRMIDRNLGQEVLGIWDFCWSLVAYSRFVDFGITTSVNRYVGRLWAQKDIAGINRVVSSGTVALVFTGLMILLGTVGTVMVLPYFFVDRLNGHLEIAQKSVFWLGLMLGVNSAVGGYNGVLTGCHRWDLQTMRNVGWYVVSVAGMLVALWLGCGLVTLAAITSICTIMAHLTVVVLAYRVCPGLKLHRAGVHWNTIKELYTFAGKTLMPTLSEMLLNQLTSVFVIASLGPAALAIFTRPRSLLRQVDALERKMAMILVPTTSSLEGSGHLHQIKHLMLKSVRYSVFLALPLVIVLTLFGAPLMELWMGPNYRNWALMAVLAIGFLGMSVRTPIFSMLSGLNAHGTAGLAQLIGSVVSAAGIFVTLKIFHGGVEWVALALTLPLLVINLVYLPVLSCRHLKMDLRIFYREVGMYPILYATPFAVCLAIGRLFFDSHLLVAIIACLTGSVFLAICYWVIVLPDRAKSAILALRTKVVRFMAYGPQD